MRLDTHQAQVIAEIYNKMYKLADNDKISFNKERRMTLRCYSLSFTHNRQ